MSKIIFKFASELTVNEIREINLATRREFQEPFTKAVKHEAQKRIFFLLKDKNGHMISMGLLVTIEPIQFIGQAFSILGIGGIVSNDRLIEKVFTNPSEEIILPGLAN
ncbi:MAG: hypothetical protein V1858_03360 [Candidatus Gottesmanbacteria bacterium]